MEREISLINKELTEKIRKKIISTYTKEYAKIGVEIKESDFGNYFDKYCFYDLFGDENCFIVYSEIAPLVCKIMDVASSTGKIYNLWGQLVNKYDTIIAQAFDDLPIVKRAYKKLGGVGTGIYNFYGQQIYIFKKGR